MTDNVVEWLKLLTVIPLTHFSLISVVENVYIYKGTPLQLWMESPIIFTVDERDDVGRSVFRNNHHGVRVYSLPCSREKGVVNESSKLFALQLVKI